MSSITTNIDADDPWNWDVNRVVKELCTPDRSWQALSALMKPTDPVSLGQALRQQGVHGTVLLTSIDEDSLRWDLRIRIVGDRSFMTDAIESLRARSTEYQIWARNRSASHSGPPLLRLAGSQTRHSYTQLAPYGFVSAREDQGEYNAPRVSAELDRSILYRPESSSVVHGDAGQLLTSDDPSILRTLLDTNEIGIKRRKIDGPTLSDNVDSGIDGVETDRDESYEPPTGPENVTESILLLSSDSLPVAQNTINVKKRKRIAPTLVTTEIDINKPRDIPTAADAVIIHRPRIQQPGIPFIGNDGRKRLIPIHQAEASRTHDDHEERSNLQEDFLATVGGESISPGEVESRASTEFSQNSLSLGYLGKTKILVDDIFYGHVPVGSRMDSSYAVEDFSQGMQRISSGRRLYMNNRMKYFLRSRRKDIQRNGRAYSAVMPYQPSLIPVQQKPSFTLYSAGGTSGVVATREHLTSWPEVDSDFPLGKHVNLTSSSSGQFMLAGSSYDDWDPSLLEKYRLLPGGDEVLPLYGESDEDNEYDYNTWKEINDERNSPLKQRRIRLKNPPITSEEVNRAIDQAMLEIEEKWRNTKLPKQERKAWGIWTRSRRNGDKDKKIRDITEILGRYENRIPKMRSEILKEQWTSHEQVKKQAQIMEPTLVDIQEAKWRISVLKRKSAPEKPIRKVKAIPKATSASDSSKEESESVGSSSESNDSDVNDFLVSDSEFPVIAEEALEPDEADGEGTDSESVLSSVSFAGATPPTPTKQFAKPAKLADESHLSGETMMEIDVEDDEGREILPVTKSGSTEQPVPMNTGKTTTQTNRLPENDSLEVVDLTMMSSDDGRPVVDPVTPKKKPKRNLFSSSTPKKNAIRISDSDEPAVVMPKSHELPSLRDPAAIAEFSFKAWATLRDKRRLLLALFHKLSNNKKQLLYGFVSDMSEREAWNNIIQTIDIDIGKSKSAKGIDSLTSSAGRVLIQMFETWIDCQYHPTRDIILNKVGDKLKENQHCFSEFYQFLESSNSLFDYKSATSGIGPLGTAVVKKENNLPPENLEDDDGLRHSDSGEPGSVESSENEASKSSRRRRKTRRNVCEDTQARDFREQTRQRLLEQGERRKKLLAKLSKDVSNVNRDKIIINDGKFDHQGYVYVPENISPRIKKHQVEGVRFMWNQIIADNKTTEGCLLAHAMGLGKTMQVITLLAAIAEAASSKDDSVSSQVPEGLRQSKTLVLCPPSLINNWYDELLIWAPEGAEGVLGQFRKIDASISLRNRLRTISEWFEEGGILVMGYEMFRTLIHNKKGKYGVPLSEESHTQVLKHLLEGPNIIIADEAHKMKNAKSEITTATCQFRSKSRIALTGSPLANNVVEYHTMINWVAPNYLGPIKEFRDKYSDPIQEGLWHDSTAAERRKAMKLLGVLKEDVAPKVHRADMSVLRGDLPPKKEFVITVPLTSLQKHAYELYVKSIVEGQNTRISQTTLWHWLAILSLLCNHPACFKAKLTERKDEALRDATPRQPSVHLTQEDMDKEDEIALDFNEPIWKVGVSEDLIKLEMRLFSKVKTDIESVRFSNKVKILCQILDASKAAGDKVLVFSQSIPTLNYLEKLCVTSGRNYARLDGSTPINKRQSATKEFNTGNTEVYLISTTAGGLGLNIPGANRVVIFDFKFNPIMEEQAVGRAYRIGQKKKVFVYRLVAGGTFEDGIHNKAVFKTQLASRVVDKKNPIAWAKKDIAAYLHDPKDIGQKDLSEFKGMDPLVLDVILASQDRDATIRAIVQTDTFEKDDNDRLTAEEQKEVDQLISDAKLQRSNPEEWNRLIQQRHQMEYTRRQIAAFGKEGLGLAAGLINPSSQQIAGGIGETGNAPQNSSVISNRGPPLSPTLGANTKVMSENPQRSINNSSIPALLTTSSSQIPPQNVNPLPPPPQEAKNPSRNNESPQKPLTINTRQPSTPQYPSQTQSSGRPLSPIMGQNTRSLPGPSEKESRSYQTPMQQRAESGHHSDKNDDGASRTSNDSVGTIRAVVSPFKSPKKTALGPPRNTQNVGISRYSSPKSISKHQLSTLGRYSNGGIGSNSQLRRLCGKVPNPRDFRGWTDQYLVAYLRNYSLSETGSREDIIARCEQKDKELLEELVASQQLLQKAWNSSSSKGISDKPDPKAARLDWGTPISAAINGKSSVPSLRTPVSRPRGSPHRNTYKAADGRSTERGDQYRRPQSSSAFRFKPHPESTLPGRHRTPSEPLPDWAIERLKRATANDPKVSPRGSPSTQPF